MSKISERLADALQRFTPEEEKFAGGNKAAGVRARKLLLEIKNIAAEGRKELSPSGPESESSDSEEA